VCIALSSKIPSGNLVIPELSLVNTVALDAFFVALNTKAATKLNLKDFGTTPGAFSGGGILTTGFLTNGFSDAECSSLVVSFVSVYAYSCLSIGDGSYKLLCSGDETIQQVYTSSNCLTGTESYWGKPFEDSTTCHLDDGAMVGDFVVSTSLKCYSKPASTIDATLKSFGYSLATKTYDTTDGVAQCTSVQQEYASSSCMPMTGGDSMFGSYKTSCEGDTVSYSHFSDAQCTTFVPYIIYGTLTNCATSDSHDVGQTCLLGKGKGVKSLTFPTTVVYKYPIGTDKLQFGAATIFSGDTCTGESQYITFALNKCVYISDLGYFYWTYTTGSQPSGAIYSDSACTVSMATISPFTFGTCQQTDGQSFTMSLLAAGKLTTPLGAIMGAAVTTDATSGAVSSLRYIALNTPLTGDSEDGSSISYYKFSCIQGHVVYTVYTDSTYTTKTAQYEPSFITSENNVCVGPKTQYLKSKGKVTANLRAPRV